MEEQMEAVQRMQDYIAAHLEETITLADLAAASRYSPWYAARLFRERTGLSPAQYIRRLRLSRSALRLRDERCRVTDVALDLGFGSVDGYQRAFYREFGCNPREYARHPVPLYLFTPYGVYDQVFFETEETTMENLQTVFVKEVEKPERKCILKRGVTATEYWTYCQEVGCDVWGLLTSIPSLEGEPVCLWLPEAFRKPGTSQYVQGVEVPADYAGPMPEGFDVITLPAAKYLRFQGEPFQEKDYCQAIQAVQAAVEKYDLTDLGYRPDPDSPRVQLEPVGKRGYIELLPVK